MLSTARNMTTWKRFLLFSFATSTLKHCLRFVHVCAVCTPCQYLIGVFCIHRCWRLAHGKHSCIVLVCVCIQEAFPHTTRTVAISSSRGSETFSLGTRESSRTAFSRRLLLYTFPKFSLWCADISDYGFRSFERDVESGCVFFVWEYWSAVCFLRRFDEFLL